MDTSEEAVPCAAAGQQLGDQLRQAAGQGATERVAALLAAGADAAEQDEQGTSALMQAAGGGHVAAVEALLAAGAPWNAVDRRGRCAGDYALEAGQQAAVEALLEAGCRAEMVLSALQKRLGQRLHAPAHAQDYLQQRVRYEADDAGTCRLLDDESKAVMMRWETPLMEAHAQALCSGGGDILNIGFGMGIIDAAIQRREPSSHTIVEAHPDVLARMKQEGWHGRPGVRVVAGRWQDVLPQLGTYDGIFFDTYGEYYEEMQEFHAHLPRLLKAGGLYSYFNGLAADNAFFHMVYCRIASDELSHLGLETQFVPLPVSIADEEWRGVSTQYYQLDTYYLPVCQAPDDWPTSCTGIAQAQAGLPEHSDAAGKGS